MTSMRVALSPAVLLLSVALAGALSQAIPDASTVQSGVGGSISGIVVSAMQPTSPIRLAQVTLSNLNGGRPVVVSTDETGNFAFRGLPAGRYALKAIKRAWLDAAYGAAKVGREGTPVVVRAGDQLTGLKIHLSPGGVITGTIRDSVGDAQSGIQVRALRFVTHEGVRTLERPSSANSTDPVTADDGVYRIYGLPPGDYMVVGGARLGSGAAGLGGEEIHQLDAATIDRLLIADSRTGATRSAGPLPAATEHTLTETPVYFPGTTDMSAAATISLGLGEEKAGVDFRFGMVRTARVRGTLVAPSNGTMPSGIPGLESVSQCRMTPAGFEDLLRQPLAAAIADVDADSRFVFPGVPPGSFSIVCVVGNPNATGGSTAHGWAEATVVVDGRDQELTIPFGSAAWLNGRVVFEGAAPKDPGSAVQLIARGFGKARLLRSDFSARPQPDGTFSFNALTPGRWTFGATIAGSSPWTLKSVTYGGRELDSFLNLSSGETLSTLVLTFTDRPSELTGRLEDTGGRPASDYFVVVFAAEPRRWTPVSLRIQSVRPGTDGVFSLKGLPTGDYYIAALTDVEPGEWLVPSFLTSLIPSSVRVTIVDGEKTTRNLRTVR